jgi:hypothetical protein
VPTPATLGGSFKGWIKFLAWEGGSTWDAFFTAASAQVRTVLFFLGGGGGSRA